MPRFDFLSEILPGVVYFVSLICSGSFRDVDKPFSLSQLQKGPVQLPRFHLAPHLSDRQQAESINLKPSEVRLSGLSSSSSELSSSPHLKTTPDTNSQNAVQIKGILKKSSSEGVVWRSDREKKDLNGHGLEQNGSERGETEVKEERSLSSVDHSPGHLSSAPWRQRTRKETSTSSGRTRRSAPNPEEHLYLSEALQITEQGRDSAIDDRFSYSLRFLSCIWYCSEV